MWDFCYNVIEDKTTPGAVLLTTKSAVLRMYPNISTEVILGNASTRGCVRVFIMIQHIFLNVYFNLIYSYLHDIIL